MEFDPDALEKLSNYAQAQDAANRIEQRRLDAILRREQLFLETIKKIETLDEDVRKLLRSMRERCMVDDTLRNFIIELSEQIERLERNQILLLTEHSQNTIREAISETIGTAHQRSLLRQYIKNLDYLQQQAAFYGPTKIPLEIANNIEATIEDIETLKREMKNGD